MSLDDVKVVKNAYGATVNDVVLAVLSGAFRRYFVERDELPDRPLVAVIPTSVRSMDDKQMGNRVSAMFTQLLHRSGRPARPARRRSRRR